jgi:hypothetical protein
MSEILKRLALLADMAEPPVIEGDEHLVENVARAAKEEIERLHRDFGIVDDNTIRICGVKVDRDLIESWTSPTPEGFAFRVVHVDRDGVATVQTLQLFEHGEPGLTVDGAIAALQELKAQGLGAFELWQMYVDDLPGGSKATVGRKCTGVSHQPLDGDVVLIS